MVTIPQASAVRAALLAAGVALFASHTAMAAPQKEISYWADAQSASRAGNNDAGANRQFTERGSKDHDLQQLASRAAGAQVLLG